MKTCSQQGSSMIEGENPDRETYKGHFVVQEHEDVMKR